MMPTEFPGRTHSKIPRRGWSDAERDERAQTSANAGTKREQNSAVPKRGRSKRGRTQKHANVRKRAQMSAKERKRKSAKECKRAQKGANERKGALPRKNCKQPGLKQPGLGIPKK